MNQKDINQIARLIYKQIIGQLDETESERLEVWRQSSKSNEELYQRLVDCHNLEKEFKRFNQIRPERPLNDMKARIKRRRFLPVILRWGIAASIFFVMLFGAIALYNQKYENRQLAQELLAVKIQPGQMQATLMLSNGESVSLGTDMEENQKNISRQKKNHITHFFQ